MFRSSKTVMEAVQRLEGRQVLSNERKEAGLGAGLKGKRARESQGGSLGGLRGDGWGGEASVKGDGTHSGCRAIVDIL
jgi:hypothetical protein